MQYDLLAAVDLGSNSFHLQIGRVVGDRIHPVDALREPVRLAAGLTRNQRLDRAAQRRALAALGRFGEHLRGFPAAAVRAVGTNALRVARNAPDFLAEARMALGFPVEVLYGPEEARLIYLGVSHDLPQSGEPRLVVDIGGGSTEFIIGRDRTANLTASLPLGCVDFSRRYFPGGRIDAIAMQRAVIAAAVEVQRIAASFKAGGWERAVASSGMARTIGGLLREGGWCERGVSAAGLGRLRERLAETRSVSGMSLSPLRPDRAAILPGGVAILSAIFDLLELTYMDVSDAALRQGVLYDLLGRLRHCDPRGETVRDLARRYGVDSLQAQRVNALAQRLHAELAPAREEAERCMLEWAAQLHEIGLSIAPACYPRHSAYIVRNADMPGFSRDEQARLADLVLAHCDQPDGATPCWQDAINRPLFVSLRLAALFLRGRADVALPWIGCTMTEAGVSLTLPRGWLMAHPLIGAALEAEAAEWQRQGLRLTVQEGRQAAGTAS